MRRLLVSLRVWLPLVLMGLAVPTLSEADTRLGFAVVDLHVDLPYQVAYKGKSLASGKGRYKTEWLKRSGVGAVAFPLYIPHEVSRRGPRPLDLEKSYALVMDLLPSTPPYAEYQCGSAGGEVGVILALEGAAPLGEELSSIPVWGQRGLRLVGLVHAHDNPLASSAGYGFSPRRVGWGLTELGRKVVVQSLKMGAIIDVSHASDAAFYQIIELSKQAGTPVVATHSNARALARHTRNLSDAQLRAIAASGGVIGINFHSPFLLGSSGTATLQDVVRHIAHVVRVAGIEHVAIGSDFEGGIRPPPALQDIRGFPKLAQALRNAAFSELEVARIMGGNARRVLCASTPTGPGAGAKISGQAESSRTIGEPLLAPLGE